MKVTIVGLGLIGGSLALDLKGRSFASHIVGVDSNPAHAGQALRMGLVDEVLPFKQAVQAAGLTVLAVPVNAIAKLLPDVLDAMPPNAVVTDMGSTKCGMLQAVCEHPNQSRYVPSHPMAGTEFSGPSAAHSGLYDGKVAIICDAGNCAPDAVKLVRNMYRCLNMQLVEMDARQHDMHVAYVSHISHISSFVLASTVLDKEKSEAAIFNLASGGFESTVRLAKSSPQMWGPIFEQNANNVLEVLDTYMQHLQTWKNHIENGNFGELCQIMENANQIGRILAQPTIRAGK